MGFPGSRGQGLGPDIGLRADNPRLEGIPKAPDRVPAVLAGRPDIGSRQALFERLAGAAEFLSKGGQAEVYPGADFGDIAGHIVSPAPDAGAHRR